MPCCITYARFCSNTAVKQKNFFLHKKIKIFFFYLKIIHHHHRVYPPRALITARIRSGIERTSLLQVSTSIACQTSWIFSQRSVSLEICPGRSLNRRSISSHRFSIGFRSGDWGGPIEELHLVPLKQTFRQGRRMTGCSILLENYLPNIKFLFPDRPHQVFAKYLPIQVAVHRAVDLTIATDTTGTKAPPNHDRTTSVFYCGLHMELI